MTALIEDIEAIRAAAARLNEERAHAFCPVTAGAHEIGAMGWCGRCGYTPPGRRRPVWTDFATGRAVRGNPWER